MVFSALLKVERGIKLSTAAATFASDQSIFVSSAEVGGSAYFLHTMNGCARAHSRIEERIEHVYTIAPQLLVQHLLHDVVHVKLDARVVLQLTRFVLGKIANHYACVIGWYCTGVRHRARAHSLLNN